MMYRSQNYSLESGSLDSDNINNSTGSYHVKEKDNDSITDLFKQMSLKDRKSRKLSDLANLQHGQTNASNKDFMTSSPIRMNSVMQIPIFTKTKINVRKGLEAKLNDDNKENVVRNESIHYIKNFEELLPRSLTVRQLNKSSQPAKPAEESREKRVEQKAPKSDIKRSVSLYRSTTSLNVTSKVTIPKPFSFETKDKAMLAHRVKIVNDNLLEKRRIASAFRANPMPISSPNLPEKIIPKPTIPVSLKFESDDRISYRREKNFLKSLVDSSSFSSSANLSTGKLNDISYLHKSPFMPKPSSKPITIPETPQLTMKSRLEQRKEFDEQMRLKDQEIQKVREELDQQRLERERIEYEKLRKQTKMKANPIRQYKRVEIIHSNKVTIPHTPKFSDRFKK